MSRVVYVGHVPFDMTEEQIEDIFRSAGPVEQTRLVLDRASGKSKGFAFVQYFEPESADSAVRNLDNYKIGNMHLKVNYSQNRFPGGGGGGGAGRQRSGDGSGAGPSGDEPGDETGVVSEIVNIVSSLTPPQKLELLGELKTLIAERGPDATALLDRNPQLAYAVVQSMFELGRIDGQDAGSLIVQPQQEAVQPQRAAPQRTAPQRAPAQSRASSVQPRASSTQPRASSAQPRAPSTQPKTQPEPPSTQPAPASAMPNEQRLMYQQIMRLTQDQLAAMPAEQRGAALAIRAKVERGEIVL